MRSYVKQYTQTQPHLDASQQRHTHAGTDPTVATQAYNSVAPFSSYGPTMDGRIKPEIIAPGTSLLSARAFPGAASMPDVTSCSTARMSGTSMATPVVAGSALVARQYFVDGYYPTGRHFFNATA